MGQGIDMARDISPELTAALDDMKDQLLIVLLNRLGGTVQIPVIEVDGTGAFICEMSIDQVGRVFTFEVRKKQ